MFDVACIDSISDRTMRRMLVDSWHWTDVSPSDVAELVVLCLALDPRELANRGIFLWDDEGRICCPGENRFLEITDTQIRGFADADMVIGGTRRRVTQIMAFGNAWIIRYYIVPLGFICSHVGIRPPAASSVMPFSWRVPLSLSDAVVHSSPVAWHLHSLEESQFNLESMSELNLVVSTYTPHWAFSGWTFVNVTWQGIEAGVQTATRKSGVLIKAR
jgi:hypothetical protein